MRATLTVIITIFAFAAYGQEKVEGQEGNLRICHTPGEQVVIDGIKPRTLECYSFYTIESSRVIQPTEVNELPTGTMPLSEDLPYVHTIRGTVYTADHLRYTVR